MNSWGDADTGQFGGWMEFASITIDHDLAFEASCLRRILSYWQAQCGGRAMPRRDDIDPVEIFPYLPALALIDVTRDEDGGVRLYTRLSGSLMEERLHLFHKRTPAEALPPKAAELWRVKAQAAVAAQAPLRIAGSASNSDRGKMLYELLLAPLSENNDGLATLLVAAAFKKAKAS